MILIRRNEGESWRDAVARVGGYIGVAHELLHWFDTFKKQYNYDDETCAKKAAARISIVGNIPDGV